MVSGYSTGQVSSFQVSGCGGTYIGRGTYLFQAFGNVPPSVATEPVSAFSRNRQRATCQPPRLPDAALRQLWVERRVPAPATSSAISCSTCGSTPDSSAAYSNVNSV